MSTFPNIQIPSTRNYAYSSTEHVSLGMGIRTGITTAITFIACLVYFLFTFSFTWIPIIGVITFVISSFIISGLRVAAQWERAVILRFGQYIGQKGPGIFYVIPLIDYARFVDIRVLTLNIPKQSVITKDNVPIEVDGVVFFRVEDVEKAIINIQDYNFAISQYAQNSLRDVVGGLTLDEVLSERERVQEEVYNHFQGKVKEWGLQVDSVRILDIQMPEDLKRVMSRQASAEREKRATIIKAEGDKLAAFNLAEAAKTMHTSEGAMELRTLQTIDGLGASPSNTVILFPVQLMESLKSFLQQNSEKDPENI